MVATREPTSTLYSDSWVPQRTHSVLTAPRLGGFLRLLDATGSRARAGRGTRDALLLGLGASLLVRLGQGLGLGFHAPCTATRQPSCPPTRSLLPWRRPTRTQPSSGPSSLLKMLWGCRTAPAPVGLPPLLATPSGPEWSLTLVGSTGSHGEPSVVLEREQSLRVPAACGAVPFPTHMQVGPAEDRGPPAPEPQGGGQPRSLGSSQKPGLQSQWALPPAAPALSRDAMGRGCLPPAGQPPLGSF